MMTAVECEASVSVWRGAPGSEHFEPAGTTARSVLAPSRTISGGEGHELECVVQVVPPSPTSVRPRLSSRPNSCWTRGLRRSKSARTTWRPSEQVPQRGWPLSSSCPLRP